LSWPELSQLDGDIPDIEEELEMSGGVSCGETGGASVEAHLT